MQVVLSKLQILCVAREGGKLLQESAHTILTWLFKPEGAEDKPFWGVCLFSQAKEEEDLSIFTWIPLWTPSRWQKNLEEVQVFNLSSSFTGYNDNKNLVPQ